MTYDERLEAYLLGEGECPEFEDEILKEYL